MEVREEQLEDEEQLNATSKGDLSRRCDEEGEGEGEENIVHQYSNRINEGESMDLPQTLSI
jgi:hypothetical protein